MGRSQRTRFTGALDAAALRKAYANLASHPRREAMGFAPRLPRLWHV